MSKPGKRYDLHVAKPKIEKPTYWATSGSSWRRNAEKLELSEGEDEERDALPVGSTRPILFRQVLMLTPGNWNGLEDVWTEGLIKACGANFSAEQPRPLQKDHSYDADHNHGKVLDLMALPAGVAHEKPALVGLIGILGAHAIERVEDGRWDQFSVGVWRGYEEEESELIELSFTKFPACGDVKILAHQQNQDKEGASVPKETKSKVLEGAGAQGQQTETEVTKSDKGHDESEVVELRAKLAAQETTIQGLQKGFSEIQTLRLEEKIGAEILKLTKEGFSNPGAFDAEKAFILSLADDEQRTAYYELRRQQPQSWRPGRESDPTLSLSKGNADRAKADADQIRAHMPKPKA